MHYLITKENTKSLKFINLFIIFAMIISISSALSLNIKAITTDDAGIKQEEISLVVKDSENQINEVLPYINYEPMVEYELMDGNIIEVTESKAKELDEIKARQEEEERRKQAEIEAKTVFASREVHYNNITVYTDLSAMNTITADQMNIILDYWASKNGTPFKGNGQLFIDASKQSGLDPVYILAHAAVESGWGKQSMSHNYFGIGAFDSNPSNGHTYGNADMASGIINGANWISRNYYQNGQTSLYTMRYNDGNHEYCTSNTWMHDINHIIQVSYSLL